MKLNIGKNLFVMDFSSQAFSWFQGETERMSLTSISVLFLQFSFFARRLEAIGAMGFRLANGWQVRLGLTPALWDVFRGSTRRLSLLSVSCCGVEIRIMRSLFNPG